MGRDTPKLDRKHEELPNNESVTADLEAATIPHFNSLDGQESGTLVYRDDPIFRALLLHFQNAEWKECLEKINQLLIIYPEDNFLLAFKQEVEIRLKQQKNSQQQQAIEKSKRSRTLGLRTLIIIISIIVLGLVILIFNAWVGNVSQATKLAQEATLTAEALAVKYQSADNFMSAGRPEEALRLYSEIQQIDPSYKDIGQKIELARQTITVMDLYQQGTQAIKDGNSSEALKILLMVENLHPKYKDTPQLIEKIKQDQQITSLINDIKNSYTQGDWAGVIHNYESLQAIDPFIQIPELKDALFISYQKLIIEITGRSNLAVEDIDTAEKYYRNALALFPQNTGYAKEREELQKISVELLANKYYLNSLSVLESSNYSIEGLQESILVLKKAENVGSDSPAIKTGIEKTQLFLNAYNDLLQQRWDSAISGLERLSRKDENFAGGRVKYFFYEAYSARGDLFLANGDFEAAFVDFQEAEKYAFGDQGNLLRLFQIEVRIAAVLRKLGQDKEAAEFYHYIFNRLGYQSRLTRPEEQDLLNTLNLADEAFKKSDVIESLRLYDIAMKQSEMLYDQIKVNVNQDDTLANIAFKNGTTIDSLRSANQLGESMIIGKDQELIIPVISTIGP